MADNQVLQEVVRQSRGHDLEPDLQRPLYLTKWQLIYIYMFVYIQPNPIPYL